MKAQSAQRRRPGRPLAPISDRRDVSPATARLVIEVRTLIQDRFGTLAAFAAANTPAGSQRRTSRRVLSNQLNQSKGPQWHTIEAVLAHCVPDDRREDERLRFAYLWSAANGKPPPAKTPLPDAGPLERRVMPQEFVEDFGRLRQGLGLQATNLSDRLGPRLHALCGVRTEDSDPVVRQKVTATLDRLAREIPESDQVAATFALGIQGRGLLTDRLAELAFQLNISTRTARRYVSHAFDRLAGEAAVHVHSGVGLTRGGVSS
jgi:hypothetical protein